MQELPQDWKGINVVLQSSSWPEMLQMADEILALAKEQKKPARALAACATVILAATLEQGVMDKLQFTIKNYAVKNKVDASETPFSKLTEESLRHRMVKLPRILSDGKYQLDPNSEVVRALHELVSVRNELLHLKDDVEFMQVPRDEIVIEDDGGITITIPVRLPKFPWANLLVEQAQEFREAVALYFKEVLDIESFQELACGRVIGNVPRN